MIFYRGNYGDVFDITSGLTNNSQPIFSLYGYSCSGRVSGNPKDVFYHYDEDSQKELLICDTNSYSDNKSILVYDLTGDKDDKGEYHDRGSYATLYVGCKFTLETDDDGNICLRTSSNKLYLIPKISWNVANKQYKTSKTQLFDACFVDDDDCITNKNYVIGSIGDDHRPDNQLKELVKRDIESFDDNENSDLKYDRWDENTKQFIQGPLITTWGFYYNENEKILYTGQCCWLCEWELVCDVEPKPKYDKELCVKCNKNKSMMVCHVCDYGRCYECFDLTKCQISCDYCEWFKESQKTDEERAEDKLIEEMARYFRQWLEEKKDIDMNVDDKTLDQIKTTEIEINDDTDPSENINIDIDIDININIELPIYNLEWHLKPDHYADDEVMFIKKVNLSRLVIFYRGNYGRVLDITTGTPNLDPGSIIRLSNYSTNDSISGNPKDVFHYYDENSKKDLLICYTGRKYSNSMLIYDLTGREGEYGGHHTKGWYRTLFVGCEFTLDMLPETNKLFIRMSDNRLYKIDKISWDMAEQQYKTPDTRLFDMHIVDDTHTVFDKDYILCSLNWGITPDTILNKILTRDSTNTGNPQILSKTMWSFHHNKKNKELYTGHFNWICKWRGDGECS